MFKKSIISGMVLLLSFAVFSGCSKSADANDKDGAKKSNSVTQQVTLDVKGMTCSGCEYSVESALKKVEGVKKVSADHKKAVAVVEYDPETASVGEMVEAVNKTGYKAAAPAQDKDAPAGKKE